MRGAEAVVKVVEFIGHRAVCKSRVPKAYRVGALDRRLRAERTRVEARLLNRAKLAGVSCPTVLMVDEFELVMSFVEGSRPRMDAGEAREAGSMLAKLHREDIIHGDFTPANIIMHGKSMTVIDFGLGFVSNDIEDKAVDVFTMQRALGESGNAGSVEAFIAGYMEYPKAEKVLARVKEVEKRVRYAF
ncbi:MAG TPA: KEOPS complex kinase/ATPase Bud32 [Candidatus Bilamarchaeum sp.]|nr:KEOPS complex kinase/ATPase Bud32 [Candidatus Bilamarchaeum sp.]